jgi:hypothetical protein
MIIDVPGHRLVCDNSESGAASRTIAYASFPSKAIGASPCAP